MASGKNTFEIVGEFIDHISPALQNIQGNAGMLGQVFAGLAGGAAAGAAIAVFEKIGEVIGDVIMEIPKLTQEAIEAADEMGKLAQRTGVAAEELQALKLAADLGDVSMKELATGLRKVDDAISKAAGDKKSTPALIFKEMGIEAKNANGELITADELLYKLADAFAASEDGAAKTKLAFELGGKALVQMIPMLNKGSEELKKIKEQGKGMDIGFSKETMEQAELFNDSMTILHKAFERLGKVLAESILPGISTLAEYMAKGAEEGGTFKNVITFLGESLGFLLKFISPIIYGFTTIIAVIRATAIQLAGLAAAANFALKWDFTAAREALKAMEEDTKKTYEDLAEFIDKSQNPEKYKKPEEPKKDGRLPNPDELAKNAKQAEAFEKALSALNKELMSASKAGKEYEVIFDTTKGQYKDFSEEQKKILVGIARQIDIQTALTKVTQQFNDALDARAKKQEQASIAYNASMQSDKIAAAGYLEAETQRLELEEKIKKLQDENKKLPQGTQDRLNAEYAKRLKDFMPGNEEYENARKQGEVIAKMQQETKIWTEALIKNKQAVQEQEAAQKQYQVMLERGLITQDQYNKLMLESKRAIEDVAFATTLQGQAMKELVVNNRRTMDDVVVKMDGIKKAAQDGTISAAEYKAAMYNLQGQFDSVNPYYAINQVQKLEDSMRSAAGAFESMFSNGIFDIMQGKWSSLGDLVKQTIDRMVANMLAAQIQFALFGDLGSTPAGKTPNSTGLLGSAFMSFFGGFREGGGDVNAGMAYVVGEKRPEIFVPKTNGTIIPNVSGATGGQPININITAMDSQSVMGAMSNVKRELVQMLNSTSRNYNMGGR